MSETKGLHMEEITGLVKSVEEFSDGGAMVKIKELWSDGVKGNLFFPEGTLIQP